MTSPLLRTAVGVHPSPASRRWPIFRTRHLSDPQYRRGRRLRLQLPPAVALLMMLSGYSQAHVRWFVDQSVSTSVAPFLLHDPMVLRSLAFMLLMFAVAFSIHLLLLHTQPWPSSRWRERHGDAVMRAVRVMIGAALFTSAIKGTLFAPHLSLSGADMTLLRTLEAVAGLMLISQQWLRLAAVLMALLQLGMAMKFGMTTALEYLNLLGLAAVVVATADSSSPPPTWSIYILRATLGVALVVLALNEKLLQPQLALALLQHYPLNFMSEFGLAFSDRLFVLCAGLAELLFGLIYLSGLVSRINTVCLALFLIVTNSYFFLIGAQNLAWMELVGHTPLFACATLLIVYGGGDRRLALPALPRPVRSR